MRPRHLGAMPPMTGSVKDRTDVADLQPEEVAGRVMADDQPGQPDRPGSRPRPVGDAAIAHDRRGHGDPQPRREQSPLATIGPPLGASLGAGEHAVLRRWRPPAAQDPREPWGAARPGTTSRQGSSRPLPRPGTPKRESVDKARKRPLRSAVCAAPASLRRGCAAPRSSKWPKRSAGQRSPAGAGADLGAWGVVGRMVGRPGPRSSGDRAVPSGGMRAGSNPAGGTQLGPRSSRQGRSHCRRRSLCPEYSVPHSGDIFASHERSVTDA